MDGWLNGWMDGVLNVTIASSFSCLYIFQISQLNSLISMLLGELSSGDRQKIMTICTIDVHARDIVANLIAQKVLTTSSSHKN